MGIISFGAPTFFPDIIWISSFSDAALASAESPSTGASSDRLVERHNRNVSLFVSEDLTFMMKNLRSRWSLCRKYIW